jgi:hypothetical protein
MPTSRSLSPARTERLLPLGIGLLSYVSALTRGSALLADPDVYLHIAVGRLIISQKFVPHTDVFSYSMHGSHWVAHEWLSEVIFAGVYDRLGWIGLLIVVGIAFALAMALLAHALLKYLAPLYVVIGTLTAWGLCFPSLVARPHVLTLPIIVAWVAILVQARCSNKAPPLLAALLMVLWANLHGSFVIGLVLAGLFAGEALLNTNDRRAVRSVIIGWGLFGVLSLAAVFITPNAVSGALLPLVMMRMKLALSLISEWQSPNFQHPQPLEIWLMLLLFGALFLGLTAPIERVVMLLVLLHLALLHQRHALLLGLVTPLLFAPSLGRQLPGQPEKLIWSRLKGYFTATSLNLTQMAGVAVALVLAVAVTALQRDGLRGAARFTPVAALTAVQVHQIAGPVFNDLNFGGYLIFSGVPTFIDGRVDVYGDDFIRRYLRPEELPGLLSQYNVSWTLLGSTHPDVAVLDHLPGWRRFYADTTAVVHVRETPASP